MVLLMNDGGGSRNAMWVEVGQEMLGSMTLAESLYWKADAVG